MYRLSHQLMNYLLSNSKKPAFSKLDANSDRGFAPEHTRTIGVIDPTISMGADFDYVAECSYPVLVESKIVPNDVSGYWLYRRGELKQPSEPVLVPQYYLDPNVDSKDQMIDITDCCVSVPESIDKLTCPLMISLSKLLQVEPGLAACLNDDRKAFKEPQKGKVKFDDRPKQ